MDDFRAPRRDTTRRQIQTVDGFGSGTAHRPLVQGFSRQLTGSGPMFPGMHTESSPKPAVPPEAAVPITQRPSPMFSVTPQPAPVAKPHVEQLRPVSEIRPLNSRLAPPSKTLQPLPTEVVSAAVAPEPLPVEPEPLYLEEQAPELEHAASEEQTPHISPIDLNLADSAAADRPKNRLQAGKTFRKWLFRGGLAFGVVLLAVGGLLFYQGLSKVHKVFKGTANRPAALQSNVTPQLLKGEGDGRVNVLLLGNGGAGHDGPDLTDTLMVASIDPVNKTATLLSVPRDLWVAMPNKFMGANQKINAAYEAGKYTSLGKQDASNANTAAIEAGFKSIDQVIGQVLGITIHYNMVVDFQAFRQAVDSVGGITVNVPDQLYDPTMAWENNHNPILAPAGVQQMNGVKALLYARSRETTSDFARGQRQRAIILALKEKILTVGTLSNPVKISDLMGAFGDNMVTDLSLSDAVRLYDISKDISGDNVQSLDLVTAPNVLVTTGNMNGVSIDQPKAGLFNYGDIQTFVRSSLKDGYIAKENAQITVLNGTTVAGLATTKANELKSYGYNITKVDNAPTTTYAKTVVVDLTNGTDKFTKHYLENRYQTTAVTEIPDKTIQPGSANFVIILGQDQVK